MCQVQGKYTYEGSNNKCTCSKPYKYYKQIEKNKAVSAIRLDKLNIQTKMLYID